MEEDRDLMRAHMDYSEVLELEPPHGFLIAQGKQTAVARVEPLDCEQSYLIVSDGEAFGIAEFEQPAQIKVKEFDSEEWRDQHRIIPRERRQWWGDFDSFYVYRIKNWQLFEGIKLYENGQVVDEPRLTAKQWELVSAARELPKQITLIDEAISVTYDQKFVLDDDIDFFYGVEKGGIKTINDVLKAAYDIKEIDFSHASNEHIPIYSLALVRNPRMRVSKKSPEVKIKQEEGESMPFEMRQRGDEWCVVKINPDESEETINCHDNEDDAQAQLDALRINVEAEEGESAMDKPRKRKPRKKELFGTEQSIEQQLNFIRRQFEDEFNPSEVELGGSDFIWVNDIFDSFVIVDEDGRLYRVDYMMFEDEVIFSPRERWVEVERGYMPKGFKRLAHDLKRLDEDKQEDKQSNIAQPEGFMVKVKRAAKMLLDAVTLAEEGGKENEKTDILTSNHGIAQKEVNGELWHFTWSTNAFMDREGEIFSTKSLENYVLEAEKKADRGYFNLWHINAEDGNFNTDFARKEWQAVAGRFLMEAGPYLDNEKGRSAKKFFSEYADGHPELAPEGWGCSPEFRYLPEERAKGIYENIWITRTSTLPRMAAANLWTNIGQLARSKMAMTEDQMKAAIAAFGKEEVEKFIAEAEKRTNELEAADVAHKSEGENPQDEKSQDEPQQLNMEDLAAEVGKQFSANLAPMVETMESLATEIKELKEWKEAQEKERDVKDKTETSRYVLELKRASEDAQTMVTEDDGLKNKKPAETQAETNDPWSQVFNK